MMENASLVGSGDSARLLLGRKLDSIPFSIYHVQIILVLGVVGFVEGYDGRSAARCSCWPRSRCI